MEIVRGDMMVGGITIKGNADSTNMKAGDRLMKGGITLKGKVIESKWKQGTSYKRYANARLLK